MATPRKRCEIDKILIVRKKNWLKNECAIDAFRSGEMPSKLLLIKINQQQRFKESFKNIFPEEIKNDDNEIKKGQFGKWGKY